ncbi:hypothetical protein NKJ90_14905 [Mesorhizobium sp. M0051]|uniref:hypothetical protein n=1 Tax=Mesorhizobium sp. M0051 TaxID=2956862 RepID=UPI0033380065
MAVTLSNRVFHITGEPSFSLPVSPPGLVAAFVISQHGHGPAEPLRLAIVVAVVLPTVTLLSWITCNLIEIPRRRAASSSGALATRAGRRWRASSAARDCALPIASASAKWARCHDTTGGQPNPAKTVSRPLVRAKVGGVWSYEELLAFWPIPPTPNTPNGSTGSARSSTRPTSICNTANTVLAARFTKK